MKLYFKSPLLSIVFTFYLFLLLATVLLRLSLVELWILIELVTFTFVGLRLLGSLKYGYSSQGLVTYFLLQSGMSMLLLFRLLILPLCPPFFSILVELVLLTKLGVFPFGVWVYPILSQLSSSVLFNAMRFQKLPVFIILVACMSFTPIVYGFVLLRLLISGILALSSVNLLSLLIYSSIGNNSWLYLSLLGLQPTVFFSFFFIYVVGLYFVLLSSNFGASLLSLLSLSGLPPFPLFFLKLLVVVSFFSTLVLTPAIFIIYPLLFLLSALFMRASYIRYISTLLIFEYSSLVYVP